MRKPHEVAKALAWHPDNVVIFIDVDSVVHGPLDALPSIRGDVALYVRTKYRRNGGMRFGTRSGTLVVRPTDMARAFVANWVAAASEAPWGDVDQTPLAHCHRQDARRLHRAPGRSLLRDRGRQGIRPHHPARQRFSVCPLTEADDAPSRKAPRTDNQVPRLCYQHG
jgi:hypothetical protein